MRHPVIGIDHGVILVRDLERAAAGWRRLGFTLTPRGLHSEHMGTGNYCFMFDVDYMELLGVLKPTPANEPWRKALETAGEGLRSLAFASASADACRAAFVAAGVAATEPLDFSRPVDVAGVKGDAAFRITRLPSGTVAGLELFVCQHDARHLVWLPGYSHHPNGARGLLGVTVVVSDPDAAAAAAARLLPGGKPIGRTADTGRGRLRFARSESLADLLPGLSFTQVLPYVAAVHFRIDDPSRVKSTLASNGIGWVDLPGDAVGVAPADASGTAVVFQTFPL